MSIPRISLVATVVACASSAIAVASSLLGLAGSDYGLTSVGYTLLFALSAACILAVAGCGAIRKDAWHAWYSIAWIAFGIASIAWPPYWLMLGAAAVLGIALLVLTSRLPEVTAVLTPMFILMVPLILGGLALVALSFFLGGELQEFRGATSPNGLLQIRADSVNPGAMSRETLEIYVVPRLLPLVRKRVYFGSGRWNGEEKPDARWDGNAALLIGGRQIRVAGRHWEDWE